MDKATSQAQHKLLKAQEARFKEKLAGLRAFIREVNDKSTEHVSGLDNIHPHIQKAEHDAQFYEERIKEVHDMLHSMSKEHDG